MLANEWLLQTSNLTLTFDYVTWKYFSVTTTVTVYLPSLVTIKQMTYKHLELWPEVWPRSWPQEITITISVKSQDIEWTTLGMKISSLTLTFNHLTWKSDRKFLHVHIANWNIHVVYDTYDSSKKISMIYKICVKR